VTEFQYNAYISSWKQGLETGNRPKTPGLISQFVRRYIWIKYNNACARCGWNTPHPDDNKPPLEVEHIDGDWNNSTEDNLILLCPNCHALTSTYRARNKDSYRGNKVIRKVQSV